MADFIENNAVKTAVRKLTTPIADLSSFMTIIQEILDNNPWGCTDYVSNGATIAGCIRGTQRFTGKIIYTDGQDKTVGSVGITSSSAGGFNTSINSVVALGAMDTAMGGSPSHDTSGDKFSTAIKCNHPNGEKYTVTIRRDSITVSSYEDDAIVAAVESWADAIQMLS